MKLVANVCGFRLAMASNNEFYRSQSVQVYKGLIAQIMVVLKIAISQQFLDDMGKTIVLAINKKSLGHYIWRHNRFYHMDPKAYAKNMQKLYLASHRRYHKKYKYHRACIDDMCFTISQRLLFKDKPRKFNEFLEAVHAEAPLKGRFYKIKKDGKGSVIYLERYTLAMSFLQI